jgi:hypothetical protein
MANAVIVAIIQIGFANHKLYGTQLGIRRRQGNIDYQGDITARCVDSANSQEFLKFLKHI